MTNKRAFTLLELLCVIAIISLLVALLMPALSKTKRIASRAVCGTYLKGFVTLSMIYLNDSDDTFPNPSEWLYTKKSISDEHPIGCRWHDRAMSVRGEIMNYSKEFRGQMWDLIAEEYKFAPCPEFRDYAKKRGCENPDHNRNIDIVPQYNYTMNGYLGTKTQSGVLRVSEVYRPSTIFFFSEENNWSVRPDHPEYPARWLPAPLSTKALDDTALSIGITESIDCFATLHGCKSKDLSRGHCNIAFIDGHSSYISVEDQLRKKMHGGKSQYGPGGNLHLAWPNEDPPPGGWEAQ